MQLASRKLLFFSFSKKKKKRGGGGGGKIESPRADFINFIVVNNPVVVVCVLAV